MNLRNFSKKFFSILLVIVMLLLSTYPISTTYADTYDDEETKQSQEESFKKEKINKKETQNISVVETVYSPDTKPAYYDEVIAEDNFNASVTKAVYDKNQDNFTLNDNKTNRFIVKYKNELGSSRLKSVFNNIEKVKKVKNTKNEYLEVIETKNKMKKEELLAQIVKGKVDNDIVYIQPDYEMTIASNDSYFEKQWGLNNTEEVHLEKNQKFSEKNEQTTDSSNGVEISSKQKEIDFIVPDGFENDPAFQDMLVALQQNNLTDNNNDISELLEIDDNLNNAVTDETYDEVLEKFKVDVNVVEAWEQTQGNGVIVAVADTGIDITHEDLVQNIWINSAEIPDNNIDDDSNGYIDDISGWDFCDNSNSVHSQQNINDEWHGTHIAGIIAAQKDNDKGIAGIAPEAKILPLKVFKNGIAYTSDIIEAIEYAERAGAQIFNCSWGSSSDNPVLKEVIDNSSMLFVCAVGNSHINIDTMPVYPASFNCTNIISVASIDKNGLLSRFSNYGESSVDVSAPGEDVISTLPGNNYYTCSGTSMSAAFVSGEIALILSKYRSFSLHEVKEMVMSTSDKLSSLLGKVHKGNKINCNNAINNITTSKIIQIKNREYDDINNSTPIENEYNLYTDEFPKAWNYKTDYPYATNGMRAASLGDRIYGTGGSSTIEVFEYWHHYEEEWVSKTYMCWERSNHAVAAVSGKLYIFGGHYVPQNHIEEYNPETNRCTLKASMPTVREELCAAVVDNKVYVIGGVSFAGVCLNTVEVYDPATDTWTTVASMPTARKGAGAAAVNGKIYVVGGFNNSGYLNTVEEYNPVTNTWTTKASMPMPRYSFGVEALSGLIYAIGGYNGVYLNSVSVYNPATNLWDEVEGMSQRRSDFATCVVDGNIYAIAGRNSNGSLSSVEVYTPIYNDDYSNYIVSSEIIPVGNEVQGKINYFGDIDCFSFIPSVSGNYNIYSMGITNTEGYLYDINGNEISYNDNSGASNNFNISYYLYANEKYYLKVKNPHLFDTGSYKVRIDRLNSSQLSGASTGYTIALSWPAVSGATGYMIEADNSVIDVGTSTSYVHSGLSPSTSHDYRVRVKNSLGTSNLYSFSTKPDDYGDNISTAAVIAAESTKPGSINYPGDVDYFIVTPPTSGYYDIFTNSSIDTYGYLYNSSGTELSYNDDYNGNTNFHIVANLLAGQTYFVKVRHYSASVTGLYNIVFSKTLSTPTNLAATPDINSINLSWDGVQGATGYDIEVDGNIYNSTSTSYLHAGLIPDIIHSYRVRARNSINTSEWSDKIYSLLQGSTWKMGANLSTSKSQLVAVEINNCIYVIGGTSGGYLSTLEKYDLLTNTWTSLASMPTPRYGLSAAAVNGKIYAIGGYNSSGYLNIVEEYDPVTNEWSTKANMPTARCHLGVTAIDGKIYAIGGYNGSFLNKVEEYNPQTNSWTTKSSMITARHSLGVTILNGKAYAIGGYNGSYLNTVEEYDPLTNSWVIKANMPTARYGLGLATVLGKVYSLGGYNGTNSYLSTVEVYDPILNAWKTEKAKPIKSYYSGIVSVDDISIYVIGGLNCISHHIKSQS